MFKKTLMIIGGIAVVYTYGYFCECKGWLKGVYTVLKAEKETGRTLYENKENN